MRTLALTQGTPEWAAHRARARNASDAPAVLGCSPYTTRQQQLHAMHTGLRPEISADQQRRFDDGHAIEATQRDGAAAVIGEPLYPVVGVEVVDGLELSASFDGLTMAEDVAYECKTLNGDLRDVLGPHLEANDPAALPKHYRVQMEQQLAVSGAERILFVAATKDGNDVRRCWYYPDPELRAEILAGWKQFEKDLAAYVPPAAAAPTPVGRAPEALPALHIEVTGMVTASNLADFKAHALAVFAGINRSLTTDADFADAEKTVKWCGEVEDRLKAAKQHALSQTESIDALFRAIDEISGEARAVRLELDKLVKAEKERRRGEIVAGGIGALQRHVAALNQRLGKPYMQTVPADFGGAIKGKKSLASMEDAVATELARAKIDANQVADRIHVNLDALRELASEHAFLFADTATLVLKDPEDCRAQITNRIAAHKAELERQAAALAERERARIRAEEEARARAQAQREQQEREAAERHQREEAEALEHREEALRTAGAAGSVPDPVVAATPAVIPLPTRASTSQPTLTVTAICKLLACEGVEPSLSAAFLAAIGVPHAGTDRAAKLWHQHDFARICDGLSAHFERVKLKQS